MVENEWTLNSKVSKECFRIGWWQKQREKKAKLRIK